MNRTAKFEYIPNTLMQALDDVPSYEVKGKVLQVIGTIVHASVPGVKVGEICILRNSWEDLEILAEVVGFAKGEVLLTALGQMQGISTLTEVIPTHRVHRVGVGPDLLVRTLPTVIFDEIDTGVSGAVAEKMALLMERMAGGGRQVLAITHLPQIAALGRTHYKVYKTDQEDATRTRIALLDYDERIREIASMMSGSTLTQAALDNAKALIDSNGR